ncbi:hypothetical protein Esti_001982 [Eimeria stiedai]
MHVSAASAFSLWPRLSEGRNAARDPPPQHADPSPTKHSQTNPLLLRKAAAAAARSSSSSKRRQQQQRRWQEEEGSPQHQEGLQTRPRPAPCVSSSHLVLSPSTTNHFRDPVLVIPCAAEKNAQGPSGFPEAAATTPSFRRWRSSSRILSSAASCSSSSSSGCSSSSSLPVIVESSSSEATSGSEEEAVGWIEVTLPEAPPPHSTNVRSGSSISLSRETGAACTSADPGKEAGRKPQRGRVTASAVTSASRDAGQQQQHRKPLERQLQQQQKGRDPFFRRLVGALSFKRRAGRPQQLEASGPDPAAAAAAAATPGIVALHAELLQLAREARSQRRAPRGRDEAAESAESLLSSSSSSTSGTPRTGGSNSNSRFPVWLFQRRRFPCRSCVDLRCMYTPTLRPRRSASAPALAQLNRFRLPGNPSLIHREQPSRHCKMLEQQRLQGQRRYSRTEMLEKAVDARCATASTAASAAAEQAPASAVRLLEAARRDGSVVGVQAAKRGVAASAPVSTPPVQSPRHLRARDAVDVLQQEKERRELQQSVFWWFGSDILLPQL